MPEICSESKEKAMAFDDVMLGDCLQEECEDDQSDESFTDLGE